MNASNEIRISLEQQDNFSFLVRFDDASIDDLRTDEPEPLGKGDGPDPQRLLLVALANCMSASLLFALRKFHNHPGHLRAEAFMRLQRDAAGRLHIPKVWVQLQLAEGSEQYQHLEHILEHFEQFCTVTQSVRQGIDVEVTVKDMHGRIVHGDKSFEAGA
jgi:organic hydroperoxide reductase OsmC/OhrA